MNKIIKILIYSFLTNFILSTIKIATGIISGSGAFIVDGIHSLSDMTTDIFAMIGYKLSTKPADDKHPLGHGKIEYITSVVIGIVIAIVGITVIYGAFTSKNLIPNVYAALIALVIILAKFLLSNYMLKKGKEYNSNLLKASSKESFSDVIISIIVLVSILGAQLSKYNELFIYSDKIAMVIVGVFIIRIAYVVFKDNFSSLIGEQVTDSKYIKQIENIIKEENIKKIDSLVILKYGPVYHIDAEVSMARDIILKDAHDILEIIENKLHDFDIKIDRINIHINPYED